MKWKVTVLMAALSVYAFSGVVAADDDHAYVGSKSCKKCHSKVFKSWEGTAHGKALETLKPGNAAEAKAKYNLEVDKDYSTDTSCLQCHTVGFGKESGYKVPAADDKKAVKEAEELAGVGCESCHGPGADYSPIFTEIMKSKRTYKVSELMAAGLIQPNADVCMRCHNDKGPTFDESKKFDFETMKETGVHEHEELKQRES